MQPLGTLLLHVTFVLTAATGLVAVAAGALRDERLMRGARYAMFACVCLYLAMAGVLWHGYFTHDFASKYIATYSDRGMPLVYLFTSFWGGEKGALLFWATILAIFSAIAVHQARDRDITYLGYATGILCGAIFFYDLLMVLESNPFETFRTIDGPMDGEGLNPLLQNPTMAIHPPSLLTGYIAFTVPFAFGASSLITGRLDDQWARDTRKWTLVSWIFLTVGLVLGGAWAYQELGWGGFWMWDPVENAGLIPWFTATAFLHSIIVQERYQMLRRWNFSLMCLTFFLTIFGTFLTRSQLIVSIHAFADSKLSLYFVYYMIGIAITAVGLLVWRWRAMKAPMRIESFLSRESFFVLNNVLLLLCAFIVLWGTLYSKISASVTFREGYNAIAGVLAAIGIPMETIHSQQELGEPWFNRVMVPAGVVLLGLTSIGPLIAWRRTSLKSLQKTFVLPFVLATLPVFLGAVALVLWRSHSIGATLQGSMSDGYALWVETVEGPDMYAFFTIWFAAFIFTGVGVEYWKGGRVRQKKRGGSLVGSMWVLALRSKRRYVGYIAHIGMALAFLGFAGAAFKKTTPETALHAGESLKVGAYTATFAAQHDRFREGEGFVGQQIDVVIQEAGETVPRAEVDRIAAYVATRAPDGVQIETRPDSPKVRLRFASAEVADQVRQELYVGTVMRERFAIRSKRKDDPKLAVRLGFADQRLIETYPPVIHQHVDEARRTLASIRSRPAELVSKQADSEFLVKFKDMGQRAAFMEIWERPEPLPGLLLVRQDPVDDALELITSGTGHILQPEVRRYVKHSSPTTEVALWSRLSEDVYIAMRPTMGGSFVSLLAFVNPMINLLWLGTLIMFLAGVLLLVPTDWLLARAPEASNNDDGADPAPPARRPSMAATAGTIVFVAITGFLLFSSKASAETPKPAPADALLGALRCVCDSAGERVIDPQRSLLECPCSLGQGIRQRAEAALRSATPEAVSTREPQVAFLKVLVAEDPSNERLLVYDEGAHKDLMTNTWCTCGCGKMALAQCPLDCPWSPHFKTVFKVLLTAGFTREEVRTKYLAEINREHRKPDDPLFTLEQIWMNRESAVSWAIPVTAGGVVLATIVGVITLRARKSAPPKVVNAAPEPERFRDDLDDLGI